MINRFMNGSAGEFSNTTLTQKVVEHSSTKTFVANVKTQLNSALNSVSGDISKIAYVAGKTNITNNLFYEGMQSVSRPVYGTVTDNLTGLKILIHDIWGFEIYLSNLTKSGTSYTGSIEITVYDHFGLDKADVEKFGSQAGFRSWFILQHYSGYNKAYKAFTTLITFNESL